jgi:hypothetical protein
MIDNAGAFFELDQSKASFHSKKCAVAADLEPKFALKSF